MNNFLLNIIVSALTTLLVLWLHVFGFLLHDWHVARRAIKRHTSNLWEPQTKTPPTTGQLKPTGAIFTPFGDAEILTELMKYEVGQRVKKRVYIEGCTPTAEHQIAEEILSLKRLSVRLEPLS